MVVPVVRAAWVGVDDVGGMGEGGVGSGCGGGEPVGGRGEEEGRYGDLAEDDDTGGGGRAGWFADWSAGWSEGEDVMIVGI